MASHLARQFPVWISMERLQRLLERTLLQLACLPCLDRVEEIVRLSCFVLVFSLPFWLVFAVIFIPSMQSDVGSVLFDPVQNAIVKTVSPTRFQGLQRPQQWSITLCFVA